MKKRAFTLIELLIVVAIIAILAAIAVPNFLEAQVRSKVSRVKADQRSLATALEAYNVDYNHYPPDTYDIDAFSGVTGFSQNNEFWQSMLTTPVAYFSSFVRDPFSTGKEGYSAEQYVLITWENYMDPPPVTNQTRLGGKFEPPLSANAFLLAGRGPTREWHVNWEDRGIKYDPTNGTISEGYIYRRSDLQE